MAKKSFSRYTSKYLAVLLCLSVLFLCSNSRKKTTHRFFSLDTIIDVTIYSGSHGVQKDLDSLERLVFALDTQLSISQPKSDVYRINHRNDSLVTVSGSVKAILHACREEWKKSRDLFDVTVEPLKFLYGLESHQERHHVPSAGELKDALSRIGFGKILFVNDSTLGLPKDMHIDLGGIAKGYILTRARDFLVGKGYENFLINTGGDLIVHGAKPSRQPWIIGIKDPRSEDQSLVAKLSITGVDMAVFTSGDYERYFMENGKRYHHLFNPATGLPGNCNRSATVVGEDFIGADAAVKAAFLMPAVDGLSYLDSRGMRGFIIDSAGTAWASKGLKNILIVDSATVVRYR
jgi:FAD:protein FMN transferase